MASTHEIIGEEWREPATELADWAMARLVNHKVVWGQHSVPTPGELRDTGRTCKAMTLPAKAQRGGYKVTIDKLTRHFASRRLRKPQLIGLHAKSEDTTSRWLGLDIDCHKPEDVSLDSVTEAASVTTQRLSVVHINILTYDFLYAMAEELANANSLMLPGAGEDGKQPLIFRRGSIPYRAFLEGRIVDKRHVLLLHLSNMELKRRVENRESNQSPV